MKTTLDLPDDLFREAKARAALRGQSLKALVTEALASHLAETSSARESPPWEALVGRATREHARDVDRVIEEELGRPEPAGWE